MEPVNASKQGSQYILKKFFQSNTCNTCTCILFVYFNKSGQYCLHIEKYIVKLSTYSDLILIFVIQSWNWTFCQSEIAGMALSHEDSSADDKNKLMDVKIKQLSNKKCP